MVGMIVNTYENETLLTVVHVVKCFDSNEFVEYPLCDPKLNEIAKITIVKVPELEKVCIHVEVIGIKNYVNEFVKQMQQILEGCKIPVGKW